MSFNCVCHPFDKMAHRWIEWNTLGHFTNQLQSQKANWEFGNGINYNLVKLCQPNEEPRCSGLTKSESKIC